MDSPCKIHGLLARDYFVLFGIKGGCAVMVFNAASDAVKFLSLTPLFIPIILSVITIFIANKQLHKKSNKPKIAPSKKAITLSNMELFKTINKHNG